MERGTMANWEMVNQNTTRCGLIWSAAISLFVFYSFFLSLSLWMETISVGMGGIFK